MATLITEPANSNPATIDWQALIAKTTKVMGECAKFRLTNMTADTEPQVEAGSRFEVNGSYYECATAESITGWSSMGLNRFVYVYATPSGGSVTFSYSETAPTFDSAKGGWFNGTARALFKLYKTTATGWTAKRYVDMVEGISGNWTNILSRDVGTDWSTAMLNSAGPGMLAELIKIGLLTGLNADLHDGYHAGNGNGQIPVSNGATNTNLRAAVANNADYATNAGNSLNSAHSASSDSVTRGVYGYTSPDLLPIGYYIIVNTNNGSILYQYRGFEEPIPVGVIGVKIL